MGCPASHRLRRQIFPSCFTMVLTFPYFHPIFTLFSRAVLEQFLLFHGQRRPRGAKNHEKNSYKENSIDSLFTMFIFVDFGENFLRLNDYEFASVFDIPLFSPYFHPILGNYRFCLLPWAVTFPLGAAAWDRGVPSPFLSKNGKNRPGGLSRGSRAGARAALPKPGRKSPRSHANMVLWDAKSMSLFCSPWWQLRGRQGAPKRRNKLMITIVHFLP